MINTFLMIRDTYLKQNKKKQIVNNILYVPTKVSTDM